MIFQQESRIELKGKAELDKMRLAGKAVAEILSKLKQKIEPGINTKFLDDIAIKEIRSLGMKPAFLGYRGFSAALCASVNEELVHGIPSKTKVLKEGDIISLDIGVLADGFYGDAAITCAVGRVSEESKRLIDVTKNSLDIAIETIKPGIRLGDVSFAIQSYAEKNGLSVIRDYVGHGIGRRLHEEPQIANFGIPKTGIRLTPGMVLCFEPMLALGDWQVKTLGDGWTVVTVDGKRCAHFEHMVAVTENGCEILTKI